MKSMGRLLAAISLASLLNPARAAVLAAPSRLSVAPLVSAAAPHEILAPLLSPAASLAAVLSPSPALLAPASELLAAPAAPAASPAAALAPAARPSAAKTSEDALGELSVRSSERFDGTATRASRTAERPAVRPARAPSDDAPLPPARRLAWRGIGLPSSALRPYEPVSELIGKAIDQAHKSIHIAMYELDHQVLFDALQRAKARGVKIEVVLDRSHVYTSGKDHVGNPRKPKKMVLDLIEEGFDVLILKGNGSGIQHNKFTLIDGELLQAGSYNYTDQSETEHFENAVFSEDAARVAAYQKYFEYMRGLAEPVDKDKLEEVLNRTEAVPEEVPEEFDALAAGVLDLLLPSPPNDSETPIRFNGESFPHQIFSPGGGADEALLRAVEAAKTSIEIAMFSFFSKPLAKALLEAKERGVAVRVVLDRGQAALSKMDKWFAWHGFEVRVLTGPNEHGNRFFEKMHNKLGLFDGKLLETGSYNYSANAENNNFENANFFDDPLDLARYAEYFARLFARGRAPKPPKEEPEWIGREPSV